MSTYIKKFKDKKKEVDVEVDECPCWIMGTTSEDRINFIKKSRPVFEKWLQKKKQVLYGSLDIDIVPYWYEFLKDVEEYNNLTKIAKALKETKNE